VEEIKVYMIFEINGKSGSELPYPEGLYKCNTIPILSGIIGEYDKTME